MKAKAGIITALSVLYSQVVQKGVFALLRIRKTETGWKFQSHIDWDCDAYETLVDEAKSIKDEKQDPQAKEKQ